MASDDPEEMLEVCAEIADLMDSDHTKAVSRLRELFWAAHAKALREQLGRCSDWIEERLSVQMAAAMRADLAKLAEADRAAQQVTSAPTEQPTRHFSAKQIQDVFESYWSGTSSMSTKAAQFVADKLNTLLDAPAEQRLRELTEDEVMSAINYWRGYNGTLTGATAMLNALVKKYGERG